MPRNKMYNKIRAYRDLSILKDNRKFKFGSIWQVRDILINIPNIDRFNKRKYHFSRCIVVIDNSKENFNDDSLLISIVPLSHQIDCKRKFDIELFPEKDNVKENSIMMLDYIQPILKKDLYKCVGEISEDKKYELLDIIMEKLGVYQTQQEIASEEEYNDEE